MFNIIISNKQFRNTLKLGDYVGRLVFKVGKVYVYRSNRKDRRRMKIKFIENLIPYQEGRKGM